MDQDIKTCGGLGLQTLGLTGHSCIVQFALERGKKHILFKLEFCILLEHEGYFVVGFAFAIRSVFRMYFAKKDILTCKESRVKKGLFIHYSFCMKEKNQKKKKMVFLMGTINFL